MKSIKNYFKEKKARNVVLSTFDDDEINSLIKIQSTEFDRKRKIDDFTRCLMREDYNNGASISKLSNKYGVSSHAVRYNVDDNFREEYNRKRSKKYKDNHSGRTIFPADLAEYKRTLIKNKKIQVAGII